MRQKLRRTSTWVRTCKETEKTTSYSHKEENTNLRTNPKTNEREVDNSRADMASRFGARSRKFFGHYPAIPSSKPSISSSQHQWHVLFNVRSVFFSQKILHFIVICTKKSTRSCLPLFTQICSATEALPRPLPPFWALLASWARICKWPNCW